MVSMIPPSAPWPLLPTARAFLLGTCPSCDTLLLMTDVKCPICHGLGWVCENHPNRAWTEGEGGCQCGAGMPCECNRANGEDNPDIETVIVDIEVDAKRLN